MPGPALFSTAYLCGEGRTRLEDRFDVTAEPWLESVPIRILTGEQLAARVSELAASVLVVEIEKVDAALLGRCPGVAVVAATRGDPVNLDLDACNAAGVLALRTPGRNAQAVAELALGLLLTCARGIAAGDRDIRADRWMVDGRIAQQRFRGPQLQGATLGLVGYGAVGHALAKLARGIGMRVVAFDPYAAPDSVGEGVELTAELDSLLDQSPFLSVHAVLNDETRHMIGAAELARLPEGAVVVNTAREPIVERSALVAALESGHVAAAGLDHFEGEYLAATDPLAQLPNTVLTPHIGGASIGADACHTGLLADYFDTLAEGNVPSGALNPELASRATERLGL